VGEALASLDALAGAPAALSLDNVDAAFDALAKQAGVGGDDLPF
jgi:glycine cleavage system regulatory protein